jgi:hypothetical protein
LKGVVVGEEHRQRQGAKNSAMVQMMKVFLAFSNVADSKTNDSLRELCVNVLVNHAVSQIQN